MGGLLALDLARQTGWAVAPRDYRSPAFSMPNPEYEKLSYYSMRLGAEDCPPGQLYVTLHRWIGAELRELRPDIVAIEAAFIPQFKFTGADVPFGLAAIVEMHCHHANIPLYRFQPRSIKKHWADNGSAKKPDMVRAAQERGLDPSDHNAADALALADFAVASLTAQGHWPVRKHARPTENHLSENSSRPLQSDRRAREKV